MAEVLHHASDDVNRVDGAAGDGNVSTAAPPRQAANVDLLTVSEAGKLLRVSDATVRNWIDAKCIPYVKLPSPTAGRKQYRIPMQALLSSLEGTYDLQDALAEQNARMRAADLPED